jgi:ketosteroid isomerase-like protein
VDSDVSWMLDRARILELTARYNHCFDEGKADDYAALFTDDGVMEVAGGPTTTGREALADMCRRSPRTIKHVTVDATVSVHGDRATQLVSLVVLNRSQKRTDQPRLMSTGVYRDELARTPEGWRFSRRHVTLDGWTQT